MKAGHKIHLETVSVVDVFEKWKLQLKVHQGAQIGLDGSTHHS